MEAIFGDILSLLPSREDTSKSLDILEPLNSFESLSSDELNFLAGVVSTDAGGALGGGGMINARKDLKYSVTD